MKQEYSLSIKNKGNEREMLVENGYRKLLGDAKQRYVHQALAREPQPERTASRDAGYSRY